MIVCKTRKWGNSIGIILPKDELDRMRIGKNQAVEVIVARADNPLKEFFGTGKGLRITRDEFKKMRSSWESKYA